MVADKKEAMPHRNFSDYSPLISFSKSDKIRRFKSLAWICALHIIILMIYVAVVGGGVAKISYFSSVWPNFILILGIGVYLAIQALSSKIVRISLYTILAGGYIALTIRPDWALIHLEGDPAAIYKINDWVLKNLPEGTPILTDRWFHPWNELAVHNPGNINYTFTVPDEPIENYRNFNWRATA